MRHRYNLTQAEKSESHAPLKVKKMSFINPAAQSCTTSGEELIISINSFTAQFRNTSVVDELYHSNDCKVNCSTDDGSLPMIVVSLYKAQ